MASNQAAFNALVTAVQQNLVDFVNPYNPYNYYITNGQLIVGGQRINATDATQLANALKSNTVITSVWLGANEIGDAGMNSLASLLQSNTLITSLRLNNNYINEAGASLLAQALEDNTVLTYLTFYANGLISTTTLNTIYALISRNQQYPQFGPVYGSTLNQIIRSGTNAINISQGGNLVLNATYLFASVINTSPVTFNLTQINHGEFINVMTRLPITQFSQADINAGNVEVLHDGSYFPLSYAITASNGTVTTSPCPGNVTFTQQPNPPTLSKNNLILSQNQKTILTTNNLRASFDGVTPLPGLIFDVTNVTAGQFEMVGTTQALSTFSQASIMNGEIEFACDNSGIQPTCQIQVSDGNRTSTFVPANMVLIPLPSTTSTTTLTSISPRTTTSTIPSTFTTLPISSSSTLVTSTTSTTGLTGVTTTSTTTHTTPSTIATTTSSTILLTTDTSTTMLITTSSPSTLTTITPEGTTQTTLTPGTSTSVTMTASTTVAITTPTDSSTTVFTTTPTTITSITTTELPATITTTSTSTSTSPTVTTVSTMSTATTQITTTQPASTTTTSAPILFTTPAPPSSLFTSSSASKMPTIFTQLPSSTRMISSSTSSSLIPAQESSASNASLVPIIAGIAGGAAVLTGLSLAWFLYRRKQQPQQVTAPSDNIIPMQQNPLHRGVFLTDATTSETRVDATLPRPTAWDTHLYDVQKPSSYEEPHPNPSTPWSAQLYDLNTQGRLSQNIIPIQKDATLPRPTAWDTHLYNVQKPSSYEEPHPAPSTPWSAQDYDLNPQKNPLQPHYETLVQLNALPPRPPKTWDQKLYEVNEENI